MNKIKTLLKHPLANLFSRWVLGFTFLYASLCKIYMPMQFARAIQGYNFVPDTISRLTAVTLPWIELSCGILLIIGLCTPGAVRLIFAMLAFFIALLMITIARGLEIDCGCFSNCFTGQKIEAEPLIYTVIRDILLIILTVPLLYDPKSGIGVDRWLENRNRLH